MGLEDIPLHEKPVPFHVLFGESCGLAGLVTVRTSYDEEHISPTEACVTLAAARHRPLRKAPATRDIFCLLTWTPMHAIAAIHRRSGRMWHVLQLAPTRLVIAILAVAGFAIAVQACAGAMHIKPGTGLGFIVAAVLILGLCGVYSAYVRLVEQRSVVELDPRGAARGFVIGLFVGSGLFCVTALILWLLGVWQINGVNPWTALLHTFAAALAAAFTEEILIRGIFFRIVEESLGSWLALALSAVIFGLLHGLNPGATLVSTIAIALEAGVLLAAAYMYARRLWLVIGLHFAWNFTEGGIFGASVSGGGGAHGLLKSELHGPDILTGGSFGPEASIVAMLAGLAAGCVFLVLAWRSGHIVAPVWRRRSAS